MPYIAPGAAAGDAIIQALLQREETQRLLKQQSFQNDLATRRERREQEDDVRQSEDRRLGLEDRRRVLEDNARARQEQEDDRTVKQYTDLYGADDFVPPDIDAKDLDVLRRRGLIRTEVVPGPVAPGQAPPSAVRFAGTAQQREAKRRRDELVAYAESLPPDSPERRAVDYQLRTGQAPPAGIVQPKSTSRPLVYVDPRTQRATDAQGNPITEVPADAQVVTRQYEPASAAQASNDPLVDAVLANPDVFKALTPSAKTAILPALTKAGFNLGSANLTPSVRAGLSRLRGSLSVLQELEPSLPQGEGLLGRAGNYATLAYEKAAQAHPRVLTYDADAKSMLAALARTSGEVGNLAQQEQERYFALAPKVTDSPKLRKAKYAAIQYFMDAALAGTKAEDLAPFLDYERFFADGGSGTPPLKSSPEEGPVVANPSPSAIQVIRDPVTGKLVIPGKR